MTKWLALVVGILFGGFGGSVFTWYMTHRTTTIAYTIVSTTTGAEETTKSLVPDLRIQIGGSEIAAVHTHVIELTTVAGPAVAELKFAMLFDKHVHVYGSSFLSPSALHHLQCSALPNGSQCDAGPFTTREPNKFRLLLATDYGGVPYLMTTSELVDFKPLLNYASRTTSTAIYFVVVLTILTVGLGAFLFVTFQETRKHNTAMIKQLTLERDDFMQRWSSLDLARSNENYERMLQAQQAERAKEYLKKEQGGG